MQRRLILAATLILALVLRTIHVDAQGLWFDEGLTLTIARLPAREMLLWPTDPTPALYYLLHKYLIPPDAPLIVIRSISIVCGVASVWLMYLIGRVAIGPRAGLTAAALLAVSAIHIDYSQEARAYGLLVMVSLVATLGALIYAKATSQGRARLGLVLFAVGNVAAFYTHMIGIFWIAATSVFLIAHIRRDRRSLADVALAFAGMAALAAPGLLRLWRQLHMGSSFTWLEQATPGIFSRILADAYLPSGLWISPYLHVPAGPIRIVAAVLAAVLIVLALKVRGKTAGRDPLAWLICAYLLLPVGIWGVGFVSQPLYMERTILIAVPGFILLMAWLLEGVRAKMAWTIGLVATFLLSALLSGLIREKEDYRAVNRLLAAKAGTGDIVVVCSDPAYAALRYQAAARAGSLVIGVRYDGRMVELEGPLGSNPNWPLSHFNAEYRSKTLLEASLPIAPGQVIWRFDSHCDAAAAAIDRALIQAGATGAVEASWPGYRMQLRRYVAQTSTIWPIRKGGPVER